MRKLHKREAHVYFFIFLIKSLGDRPRRATLGHRNWYIKSQGDLAKHALNKNHLQNKL